MHCKKLEESWRQIFPIHSWGFFLRQKFNEFLNLNKFVLNKKCLRAVGFFQLGALYATITHDPRS